jgi:hypothetical protein
MPRLLRLVPLFLLASLAIAPSYGAQWNPQNPVQSFHKDSDGATIFLKKGALRFQVCTDSMVRVRFSPEREFPKVPDYVVIKSIWPQTPFDVTETAETISLTTAKLKLLVTKKNSVVVFYDSAGKKLAQENDRTLTAREVNGEKTYHLERFTNMWDSESGVALVTLARQENRICGVKHSNLSENFWVEQCRGGRRYERHGGISLRGAVCVSCDDFDSGQIARGEQRIRQA